ncbi:hypothetical protein GCU56_20480 [Geodermatophilus sabuli]|uniref:Uncharacterized protein n=1 Tax=Geodermatophilus sabuli TaxID=1564158 RepID=A0A7K3W6A1_9ACTN|nr:hypothetical protein [Geodermatophilus sabuli]NEK60238.1 hypothetical protein [Geodermatophilus sabuli]
MTVLDEPLASVQLELLDLIWEPIGSAVNRGHDPDWPVWDFVRRSLLSRYPTLETAEEVLSSIPALAWGGPSRSRRYGLVWHEGHIAMSPGKENRVGLTIAGLAMLARSGRNTGPLADALAAIIGTVAAADEALSPDPFEVVQADVPLSDYTASVATLSREQGYGFPDRLIADGLGNGREYALIAINQIGRLLPLQVLLGRQSLRPFRYVRNADDYLTCIDTVEDSQREPVHYSSPLTLVQTLDYLGYVLAADPQWFGGPRLTVAPDLQSAASLGMPVTTRSEYESALSALWNVLAQLNVPAVPKDILAARFHGKQPGSIGRLQSWLETRDADPASRERCMAALATVRQVGRLRTEPQHGSPQVRRQAVEARRRLGLPDVVHDYEAAWSRTLDVLAGAFNVIREEVQGVAGLSAVD